MRDDLLGSKEGEEEKKDEGISQTGPSMEVTEGLMKWAILRVGLLSPTGETMKSFLDSIVVSNGDSDIIKTEPLASKHKSVCFSGKLRTQRFSSLILLIVMSVYEMLCENGSELFDMESEKARCQADEGMK